MGLAVIGNDELDDTLSCAPGVAAEPAGPARDAGAHDEVPFLFPNALSIPGTLHILHNAMHQVSEHMSSWTHF